MQSGKRPLVRDNECAFRTLAGNYRHLFITTEWALWFVVFPISSDTASKLSSDEVNLLANDFYSAYRELPESPSVKAFVSSMLRNTNELSDQDFYKLHELSSNISNLGEGRGCNNFLSSVSDVINLMQQHS